MATNQLLAITGRRKRPTRYGETIRTRASFLPEIYAARDREALEQEQLDLERQRLDLSRRGFERGQQDTQTANKLAAATLGLQGAMLIPQYRALNTLPRTSTAETPTTDTGSGTRFQWGGFAEADPWATGLGGLLGGYTGSQVTEAAGGEKRGYKVAGGAIGGGAGAYYSSGGDPYSAALGALLGGTLGGFL